MTSGEAQALLLDLSLYPGDVPLGYSAVEGGGYESNEELAETSVLGREAALAKLEEFGRIMSYTRWYSMVPMSAKTLTSVVTLFRDSEGATAAYQWIPAGYTSQEVFIAEEFAHNNAIGSGIDDSEFDPYGFQETFAATIYEELGTYTLVIITTSSTSILAPFLNVSINMLCNAIGRFQGCVYITSTVADAASMDISGELLEAQTALIGKLQAAQ